MSTNPTYFSNHSQRQPAHNASGATTQTARGQQTQQPMSKSSHFSNKVLQSSSATNGDQIIHPLRHTWVVWFQHRAPGSKTSNYESGIKRVASFSSLETFWSLYTHLNPPSLLTPTTDYLLFHSAVKRPVWEDPVNERGGKWIVRLRKGVADRVWEEIVLAVIGEQFVPDRSEEEPWLADEICGCTISVRSNEDILAIWHKSGADEAVRARIRDTIRKVLQLGPATILEYKSNNDSMQDKSSFRTTSNVDRSHAMERA
ncbi:related to translation initiation factor 4e [Serendipita indica DSM 11827]|uniref:Related to translation initiation factor 4e n=1 Tax=Serendipita indica (strain DSM 11827) TaxID=1109443 RepID=G4T635_SERID|nr:related to translation initiation factor 4e [Serendipita indica DSM 11827]